MAYIISSGEILSGIILENDSMTATNGGIQIIPDFNVAGIQLIYLDFDGELTKYRNVDMDLEIDDVQVEHSNLTPERIAGIIASLNTNFSVYNVLFTAERPKDTAYSTIFVGKTSAFDQYGPFAGLAETVDLGNQIKNDNAFVLLDAANSDSDIVSTIAHEAEHLLGTLDHGGDGLVRYADDEEKEKNPGYVYYYYVNNCTLTGNLTSSVSLVHCESSRTIVSSSYREDGGDAYVSVGKNYDEAHDVKILSGGCLWVYSGYTASNIELLSGGTLTNPSGTVSGVFIHAGGYLKGVFNGNNRFYDATIAANGANAGTFYNLSDKDQTLSYITVSEQGNVTAYITDRTVTDLKVKGSMYINTSGIVSGGEVASGGYWNVSSGGYIENIKIDSGASIYFQDGSGSNLDVLNGGKISDTKGAFISGLTIRSGGTAQCVAYDVYVEKGATLMGAWERTGVFHSVTLAEEANAGTFYNLSDKDQTLSYIEVYGDGWAYITDRTVTDLKAKGSMTIKTSGIVSGGEVASGGYWNVSSGGYIEGVKIASSGFISINSGGVASNIELLSGGTLTNPSGTVSGVFIHAGGYLKGVFNGNNRFYDATIAANGANAGTFYNLSDKDQTLSYITVSEQGNVTAYITDRTVTDLKVKGSMYINTSGIVSGGEVASGGNWTVSSGGIVSVLTIDQGGYAYVNSGGRVEQSFDVAEKLTIDRGGVAQIWSASTVSGESASLVNSGTIEFLVASAVAGGDAPLLNDYTKVSGNGGYTITVNGDQSSGQYCLIGNAAAFNKNVTITAEGSESSGTFTWNGSGYNTVYLDDRAYTLNIDENNDLVLGIGMNPTRVDYQFAEIGQTVYYNGTAPEGSGLEGVLMAIPYTADITVSFDKSLAEGLYEFTTSVAEVDGSVNHFQIQISDGGIPGSDSTPAPKSVSYNSHDMCIPGTLVSETNSTVTYKFTGVEDYLLIDRIPQTTMGFNTDCGNAGNSFFANLMDTNITYLTGNHPDVNKPLFGAKTAYQGETDFGLAFSFVIDFTKERKTDISFSNYGVTTLYKSLKWTWARNYDENNYNYTITIPPQNDLQYLISLYHDEEKGVKEIRFGDKPSSTLFSSIEIASCPPEDLNHCWLAEAVNMMVAGGYLEGDAQKCYRILTVNYFRKDNNKSKASSCTRVFYDFLYKKIGYNICKGFYNDSIDEGLQNMQDGEAIVGAIDYYVKNNEKEFRHTLTCYEVKMNSATEAVLTCVDSDDWVEKELTLVAKKEAEYWFFDYNGLKCHLFGIETLIANNDPSKRIKETDIRKYEDISPHEDGAVYAILYGTLVSGDVGNSLVVSDWIFDSIIMENGFLEVSSDAETEEMVVHAGGNAKFNSGSIAKGTIRTAGGVLTVESGVNVSEAEFDFAVSYMDGGNSSVLLNDLHNVSGAKLTITVVNGQSAGKYVLAGGASDFKGVLSVVGEYDYTQDVGEGFDNGLIGELGLDNTLNIEHKIYSLAVEDDNLALVISAEKESQLGIVGDFNGDGKAMLVTESDNTFTVYSDGTAWGGLTLEDDWFIAGVGDFDGDNLDDFLRVNTEGYVVGEMSNGNGTFSPQVLNLKNAGWDILGTGDFNGNGSDDVLVANPTGASDTVGLLGYWESGVTWTLINGYSPEWECVSTGDFNGDGKCDMLWRNSFVGEGGLTYNAYCTWIVENAVDWRMVSVANPDEWNFLCSGDFDGNGSHDIAMINNVGVVGIWGVNDGYLNSWSILSAVDTSSWTLAGVGDFNGDGTDDIAWASDSLNLAGYWQINDKQLTTWANIAAIS